VTPKEWFTLAIVVVTVVLLVRDTMGPAFTVLGAVVALMLGRVITAEQALSGFANAAPITVAALYVIARGVQKTGGLQPILRLALGQGKRPRAILARLLLPTSIASAFLNNTPIVAMLVTPVVTWAERRQLSPSTFLMPLVFAVTLGGVTTAIGTSTNLLVSGLLESDGAPPIGLFELSPLGVPVAAIGVIFLILASPRLLPKRRGAHEDLAASYREFSMQMNVASHGPLDGKTVERAGLRHLEGVFLVEIEREGESHAPVSPTMILRAGDRLTFVGRPDVVVDLHTIRGLVSAERTHMMSFDSARHTFMQAVIGIESGLVGTTLREARFRERYQAAVVAVHRAGHRINAKLGTVPLRAGDTLVLLTDPGFAERWRDRSDFLMVSQLGGAPPAVTRKAWIAGLVMLLVVLLAGSGLLPILQAALVGAGLVVIFGVLTPAEARSAVDLEVVLMIVGAIGLGTAVQLSGLADRIASPLVNITAVGGATAALAGVVLATILITEFISNNAAAALMFPIAISTAQQANANPRTFAMAVAIAASCAFLTPIGYQTNMMVYGPGGYHFGDYSRLGAPLTLLTAAATILLAPIVWPL
jgi:di/tricarboxylate transporter